MALRPFSPSLLRMALSIGGAFALCVTNAAHAQWPVVQSKGQFEDKFRQLEEILPTPNTYRNAGGAPGFAYWQQQADYSIKVSLDEAERRITGSETITYTNNSPDSLPFLWVQLDQNRFRSDSLAERSADFGGIGNRAPATRSATGNSPARISFSALRKHQAEKDNDFGFDITAVTDADGEALSNTINGTLMRIDLEAPLRPNQKITFTIDWAFNMVEENAVSARAGYETFDDGNDIFLLAQWYPRMAAYSDYEGWHNKEFMGRGEFTLEFGDFDVEITVPSDHIVSASGVLQNPDDVLTETHKKRLETAKTAERPVFIVTAEEALEAEKSKATEMKTWKYRAENVRDFAWASSRKFIWDAQGYEQGGDVQPFVMAMSFYPKEGEPLWSRYSTQAVIHTMEVYSRMTFDYPYPVSQSVNGPVGGMEYPMITFNGPRTELQDDGERTYSAAEKRFLIGVVIHEVGHNYFPMIVNSDERQWTWMDEGLNTFLQFVSEQEWDPNYRSRRGEPRNMVSYMKSTNQVPIMTNSESILQFGNNAYGKPATALNILRETILGRELFDFAFKTYANRWKFKRPTPSDLFRTLEEASGVDLDWFWHGWFYTTDHVDLSIENVVKMRLDTEDPDIEYKLLEDEELKAPVSLTDQRNAAEKKQGRINDKPWLKDFYDNNSGYLVTNKDRNAYTSMLKGLKDWERTALERAIKDGEHFYVVNFANKGGLVMPLILNITYTDDSTEEYRIPAEIWRRNAKRVSKLLIRDKEIKDIVLDPNLETADVDLNNNYFPRRILPSRIEAYKSNRKPTLPNRDLIQDVKTKLKKEGDGDDDKDSDEG
ncbi:MAG: M1 family metallopeptidase [Pseudomonadota bacterium]